jgi:hypothetical protein
MARATIKSTYSLDPETVDLLEQMAREWDVSKSEALRRAIRAAAASPGGARPADALDQLQAHVGLRPAEAKRWAQQVRAERKSRQGKR